MLYALLIATNVATGFGLLSYWIGTAALAYYIEKNGFASPSDHEIKECTHWVIANLFKRG